MKKNLSLRPIKVTVGSATIRIYRRIRTSSSKKTRTVYEVASKAADGKRQFKGFNNEADARREAERIASRVATGNAAAAMMTNAEAETYGRAIEFLRPTGIALEVATAHFAEAVKIMGCDCIIEAAKSYVARNRKVSARPVADVVTELLAVKMSRKAAKSYLDDLRSRLKRFTTDFHGDAGNVTTASVQTWLDRQGFSRQGYCDYRNRLNLLFNFAVARGYAMDNPVASVEKIKARGGDLEIFKPVEIAKLLSAASPEFLPSLAIGAFAGLRSAEIERLSWEDVDLAGCFITVGAKQAKTASRRVVPIHDNLAVWLAPYSNKTGLIWAGTHFDFYHEGQQGTAKAAGVAWKSNALRHSYASYRLAQTGDAGRVAGELGNTPAVVHRHYKELVRPDAAAAWFAVKPDAPANVIAMAK